jgi:hypothetical protein
VPVSTENWWRHPAHFHTRRADRPPPRVRRVRPSAARRK